MTKNDKKVPQGPNDEKINAEMNAAENVAEGMIEEAAEEMEDAHLGGLTAHRAIDGVRIDR